MYPGSELEEFSSQITLYGSLYVKLMSVFQVPRFLLFLFVQDQEITCMEFGEDETEILMGLRNQSVKIYDVKFRSVVQLSFIAGLHSLHRL
jgi:hypothetical protein